MNTQKILKAGEIAKQVKIYARSIVKKDVPLVEIANSIETKIIELLLFSSFADGSKRNPYNIIGYPH